ncbi:MAG: fasciclin domain-containing protein, partial [Planctomycetales bacterium]|nr:fasciclin domain-containing protein [Planctomycetales bacterium]
MRTWTSGLVVAILAAGLAAPRAGAAKDIVETAVGAGSFKTLAAALQ